MRIILAVEPTDFRKGIDGLARLCRSVLESDPFSGYLFVFMNKGKTAIKMLIRDNPNDSRRALSEKLCMAWNWRQPNGALKDMVCRGFMLELHRAGYINLPAKRRNPNNPLMNRRMPDSIPVDDTSLSTSLKQILPLEFCQVRRSS
jgi:transposase